MTNPDAVALGGMLQPAGAQRFDRYIGPGQGDVEPWLDYARLSILAESHQAFVEPV
jgi:hypothetical protein